jgi:hypothetical protein
MMVGWHAPTLCQDLPLQAEAKAPSQPGGVSLAL